MGFADLAQPRWQAWRRKQQLQERTPASFSDVLTQVKAFADPCLADQVGGKTWRAAEGHWT
ncbi:hypothetical protein [Crossiella sp. CA198]|uniref:hypothetical protein n=1 Tax=Crossiella sp. CA198 TaxID=3455607 RepID=UPI003F8D64BA